MPHAGGGGEDEPLLRPHLVTKLKNRPRLVDFGVREEVLELLEDQIAERRKPDHVASKAARTATNAGKEATEPVVREAAKRKMARANENSLSKI